MAKSIRSFDCPFDARVCYKGKIVEQKLDYIHHDPVKGKWALEDLALYSHSSAGFYVLGKHDNMVPLVHYKDLGKLWIPRSDDKGG